ncbi:MAG: FadR/GntR family transcriptional regulator [Candidatus Limnocylindrales bacterium]
MSDKIQGAIIDHVWQPGERLPTEAGLAGQFRVSRTVIREAIRTLVGRGLVERRPGHAMYVAAASEAALHSAMSLYLRRRARWHYPEVHEVRAMFEVQVASMAAERATDVEIRRMEDICERMLHALNDTEDASLLDMEFHRSVAQSTQNALLPVMLDAISDALLEIRLDTFGPNGRAREALQSHVEILGRIKDHDPQGARDAMGRHLGDVARYWQLTLGPAVSPPQRDSGSE